jgi:sugar O-acyltransferase (sialic acid O-acetyltransferase NeuD family)
MPGVSLAIVGSSDLAKLIAHHAIASGFRIAGFFDNRRPIGTQVEDFGIVMGNIDDVDALYAEKRFESLSVGVGYLQFAYRREVFTRFKGRIPFSNVVDRSVVIAASCTLGEGLVIGPGCVLDAHVTIQDNVLLNAGVVVAHHSVVGAHSFVAPAAAIAGDVRVGLGCFIGINSTVIDGIKLGDGVKIAAGAVVVRDAEEPGWYIGVPAKKGIRRVRKP